MCYSVSEVWWCPILVPQVPSRQDWLVLIGEVYRRGESEDSISLQTALLPCYTRSDHRNKTKKGDKHHPGICMALSVLLKERSREMSGLQTFLSLVLFSTRVNRKVCVCVLEGLKQKNKNLWGTYCLICPEGSHLSYFLMRLIKCCMCLYDMNGCRNDFY